MILNYTCIPFCYYRKHAKDYTYLANYIAIFYSWVSSDIMHIFECESTLNGNTVVKVS